MALASFRLEASEIRRRTAAIWSPKTSSKPAQSGTGIWIGGNLLLTAHHVCVSDRVHYRWVGETEWVEEASVIQRDVDLDVAVVEVTPRSPPAKETPIWFSFPTARELEATAMGYPSFQKPDTKILELDDIGGKCRPAAGRDGILRMVTSRHYASAKEDDWKGISGAGLFVEDVLAGVVIEAKPNGLDARTLEDIRRKESLIWALIKPYVVDHMQEGQFGGLLQLSVNARAHDLELWLGEPSYQKAIWGWLFSLDEAGLKTYTRKQVEERFSASPLTRVLNTISHLVDELKLSYDEKEARYRARSLLFNLLPLHSDLSLENDDIGSDVKDALRIRGQLDLCRTPKKILARRELHLPRGIGSATISALDQSPGLVKAFVGVVQEQMKWDEQTALEAIEGDTLRYIDEVEVQIARKKNTDEIERPFFITLSQAEENSDLVLETL